MDPSLHKKLLNAQKNEITEYYVYSRLASKTKNEGNKKIIQRMADDELSHYSLIKSITNREIKPSIIKVWWYTIISYIFGVSFGLNLMEKGESIAQEVYASLESSFKQLHKPLLDEQKHEKSILALLKEARIEYAGSIVLGLNDALVELTGALAGLTFALQNGALVATTGVITGFAASLSMSASNYLQSKEEPSSSKDPFTSALFTGVAYIITVTFLVLPYILIKNIYIALAVMLAIALFIVLAYTFYITTAKNLKFWKRFLEMALISLAVAALSFGAGLFIRAVFGVEV